MHVAHLDVFHVRVPLRRTVRHASHTRNENDTLFVRCRLSDGTIGWGEGLPRPYVTGETIETALALLRDDQLPAQLDAEWTGIQDVIGMLLDLKLSRPDRSARDCFGNSVRCAIELSVLDAVCRWREVPLTFITTQLPEVAGLHRPRERVQYSGAITAMRPRKQILSALANRLYGFRQCKIKVGVEGQDDQTLVRRLRRLMGNGMDLRIDVNEAWTAHEVYRKLERLRPFGISAVEQPVPHQQVGLLADVRSRIGLPVILDESLCTLADATRAVDEKLCDVFNIRLSKCGGFLQSLKLAAFARQSGMTSQLGCQVGESGILSAAGRHFATSVAGLVYLEGSFDRHLLRLQFTRPDITFHYGGWASALPGPGLGIDVDGDLIASHAVFTTRIPVR